MKKKVTLKQLAKELNLSISTVSKSLKNDPEISQKTIDRVHELANFYNYKPNPLAVSLKSSKTHTIGVLLPDILNHFFAKTLFGIEQEATKKGYKIVTCITNESYKKELEYVEMLSFNSVDGFIVALSQETQVLDKVDHFKDLVKDNIPVVMFDRVSDEVSCDKVIVDDKKAAQTALQHLIDTECKQLAVISTIPALSVGKLRLEGVQDAMLNQNGVTLKELLIQDPETAEYAIENFLKENEIDGVISLDETAASITINMAKKLGYNIPQELSVIGFADGLLSKHSFPKLSSVSQHAESLGRIAVESLIERLEHNDVTKKYIPKTEIVKTTLIHRESTK